MRASVLLLCCGLLLGACKKSPSYDRSSPEATLKSFFSALDAGRLPEDLGLFLADETELASWKMRCRARGCARSDLTIVEGGDASGYSATVIADYTVYSKGDLRVMRGQRSPIRLQRDGDIWRITQFGRRIVVPSTAEVARDGGAGDATPPADALPSGDAGAAEDR